MRDRAVSGPDGAALNVTGLRVSIGGRTVVDGIDLAVAAGECVAIVGESGAGKSITARALVGLAPDGATVSAELLMIAGQDMRSADAARWRRLRGQQIALVSQDALVSLDPFRRIGREIEEPLEIHTPLSATERRARTVEMLATVAMPDPERRARSYPHELSGGLRQRALIASALVTGPRVLIADEPTTALDATVQLRVLRLLRRIVDDGTAVVLISHDLAAVAHVADRIIVMRGGAVVESGPAAAVLAQPQHDYTRQLVGAWRLETAARETAPRESDAGAVVLSAAQLSKRFSGDRAVEDVSLELRAGRTLGVVGESGSGKTTLARLLLGIETPDAGTVTLGDMIWNPAPESARRPLRTRIQLVHQNPRAAFNPRWTISRSLEEAIRVGQGRPERPGRSERRRRVAELLAQVELAPELAARRPGELSGGQRQRAAIARALAVRPDILVLDEPVSALDASVQVTVLALLARLQRDTGIAMLLISHDLRAVASLADDVLVMRDGRIVESGSATTILGAPQHEFTQALVTAAALQP